jgi:hypothetical protein
VSNLMRAVIFGCAIFCAVIIGMSQRLTKQIDETRAALNAPEPQPFTITLAWTTGVSVNGAAGITLTATSGSIVISTVGTTYTSVPLPLDTVGTGGAH